MVKQNKTTLIIGASSGIGKSLFMKLREEKSNIYTISRRDIKINRGKHFKLSISDYSTLFETLNKIKKSEGNIDCIINCSGVGFFAPLNDNYIEYWKKIIDTNVLGLINLLSCMLQLDIPRKHIVHVGSLAAYRASKTLGNLVYSSTKTAALPLITEYRKTLRSLKKRTKVTLITPGFVEHTDFGTNFFESAPELKENIYGKFKGLLPEDIAESIIYSMRLPNNVEISEIIIRPVEQED